MEVKTQNKFEKMLSFSEQVQQVQNKQEEILKEQQRLTKRLKLRGYGKQQQADLEKLQRETAELKNTDGLLRQA